MSPGVWKLRWSLADFVEMEKKPWILWDTLHHLFWYFSRLWNFITAFSCNISHFAEAGHSQSLPAGRLLMEIQDFFLEVEQSPVTRREKELWSSGSVQTWQRHDCNLHTSYFSQVTSNPYELQVRSISNSGSTFNGKKSPRNQMKIHHL